MPNWEKRADYKWLLQDQPSRGHEDSALSPSTVRPQRCTVHALSAGHIARCLPPPAKLAASPLRFKPSNKGEAGGDCVALS